MAVLENGMPARPSTRHHRRHGGQVLAGRCPAIPRGSDSGPRRSMRRGSPDAMPGARRERTSSAAAISGGRNTWLHSSPPHGSSRCSPGSGARHPSGVRSACNGRGRNGGLVVARRLPDVSEPSRQSARGPALLGRVSSAAAGDDRELFECLVRVGWLGGPPVDWRRRCHRLMTQRGWAVAAFEPSDHCLGLTAIRCRPRSRTVSPSLSPFLGP
jgi:hypothetical protein